MFKIYYLRFTKYALDNFPRAKKKINEHYVFSHDKKFYVMTSKPVVGLKSTYIHTPNIEGQETADQFVIENPHVYNPKYHMLEHTDRGMNYLAEHKEKFSSVMESIKKDNTQ